MESKRDSGSASSFTSELFDRKDSHTSDLFASIFPPSKGVGEISARSGSWQRQSSGNQQWNTKQDKYDDGGHHDISNKEERTQPCYLSSSLYYGGQEVYSQPPSSHTTATYTNYKKGAGEEDPTTASRGNWWQGSLYY